MRKFKKWLEHLLKHNTFIQTLYRVVMSAVFKFIGLFIRTDENLVLMNGHGFRYNDSPRAIYEKMAELGMLSKYRVVWALREAEKYEIEGAEKIEIDTPKYFITALRAKYWISCVNIERALHFKKKNTVYLNTWHGDRAFKLYSKIAPAYREEISDKHKMEPYVYSQMIAGKDAKNFGQAKNSWLTGTAAWNFYVISNYILGIKPDWYGLKIDPCVPHDWDGYKVSRRFRGATYEIAINNPDHVCRGVKAVTVDGTAIDGNVLPVFADGQVHQVEVTLG